MYYNNFWTYKLKGVEVICFGASKLGEEAIKYLKTNDIKIKFFCDNNPQKNKDLLGISVYSIESLIKIPRYTNIIITSSYYKEILHQLEFLGFYNIFKYFDNTIEKELFAMKNNKITNKNVDIRDNILKYTNRVSIELSNMCNYASIHKKCPLSKEKEHITLSYDLVIKIFESLKKYKFDGMIAFHTYNEPLIDPRLFLFIKEAKHYCPNSDIYILTNGYYLNQNIADELIKMGVTFLEVTAYTTEEFNRLKSIDVKTSYKIYEGNLDDRLNLYEESDKCICNNPCYAPLNEIIIKSNGNINLCCLEWKQKHCFGNIHTDKLEDIILNSNILDVYKNLSKGNRELDICKNCSWIR